MNASARSGESARRVQAGPWAAIAAALVLLGACTPKERPAAQSAFSGRVNDWTREIALDSPELAAARALPVEIAGDYADRLDDRSPEAEERRRSAAIRRYAELRAFESADLAESEQRTHQVLSTQFGHAANLANFNFGSFEPLGAHRPYALDQQASAFITLPDFLDSRHPIDDFADAESYVRRLRAVPGAITGEVLRTRNDAQAGIVAPDFIIDRTLELLDRAVSTPLAEQVYLASLRRKLDAKWPAPLEGQAPTADRRRVDLIYAQAEAVARDRIAPALQQAAIFLRGLRAHATHDAGVWKLPNGQAYYADLLRAQTTTSLTPEQIHNIGLNRVNALNSDADVALRRIGLTEGSVGQRLAQLTSDPQYRYPDTEEGRALLLSDVRGRVNAIMGRAPQWFGALPRARLEVRRAPLLAEAAAPGAYYEAPAIDGSHPGVYYINLRNMAEMTRIDLPTQDFHEAVPGHHFQVALAQEQENLPLLRRLMGFNAYAEGWGLYAEQLADENNLYETDLIGRIGYLRWQLWRAARLVVDTGIHAKRWTREQAIDYLVQTTGDAPQVVITEVERYAANPGQACGYELGRREIARLRDEARRALGDRFDQRAFHDVVLLNGEVPLTLLERIVRDWIAEQT